MSDALFNLAGGMTESDLDRGIAALLAAGEWIDGGASARFLLDDPDSVWLVAAGRIDLYAVELKDGQPGPRRFLWSAEAPAFAFGVAPAAAARSFGLLGVGSGGTRARRVPLAVVRALARRPETAGAAVAIVDGFVVKACAAMGQSAGQRLDRHLVPGQPADLPRGQHAGCLSGVVWARSEDGPCVLADADEVRISPEDGAIPLANGLWLTADADGVRLAVADTATVLGTDAGWMGFERFRTGLSVLVARTSLAIERADRDRLTRKAAADARMRERSLAGLAGILAARPDVLAAAAGVDDPLLAACRAVGAAARIEFREPPRWEVARKVRDPLASICRASRVRSRQVALRGRWWEDEHGALLAYLGEAKRPVALVAKGSRRYELFDPAEKRYVMVDAAVAASLDPFAVEFYRPSPDRPITLADLGRTMAGEIRADLARLLLASLASGIIGLALPIATGMMFREIIPTALPATILPLVATLVGLALGTAMFDLTRAFALTRIEGRTNSALQSSIVDRLLTLPVPFFRAFSVGDLAMRAAAINQVRELLSGATITTVLTGVFSVTNLALLFYYSSRLAFVALAAVAVTIAFQVGSTIMAIRVQRRLQNVSGRIAGLLFETIGGIAKLRVAGAEGRVFAVWANKFREQRELAFRAGTINNVVTVFNGVLPSLSGLALFAVAGSAAARGAGMNTGTFVAFNAAFGSFFAATVGLGNTAASLLNIVPIMERAKPILDASPETDTHKPDPGELSGHIEVGHVSFRYAPDGPLILDRVSFEARPGELVALVGPSGSGKSTLLRLLLGFEPPESGAIYFDGQDLSVVDVTAVRAQIGVVLQTSRMLAGDIFTNIIGSSPLTLDDAWAAARLAGLAEDIEQMPMGMHTVIAEGGSTLSGGQRQRLMIARALVRKPRIVFFDEATSALDNRTQEVVSRSLQQMKATRIVIAHRLSTIRNADRLYVLDRGRVVQHGTYDELAAAPGTFAQLIARQLV